MVVPVVVAAIPAVAKLAAVIGTAVGSLLVGKTVSHFEKYGLPGFETDAYYRDYYGTDSAKSVAKARGVDIEQYAPKKSKAVKQGAPKLPLKKAISVVGKGYRKYQKIFKPRKRYTRKSYRKNSRRRQSPSHNQLLNYVAPRDNPAWYSRIKRYVNRWPAQRLR